VPNHVKHCSKTGAKDTVIWFWEKDDPSKVTRVPYVCKSWRCPECRDYERHVTYARATEAFAPLEPGGLMLFVLTLDRDGYFSSKPWRSPDEAFRAISSISRKFLKRVNRMCERRGWSRVGNKWISTVEVHRTGWPHVNFVVHCPELANELAQQQDRRVANGATEREATLLGDELLQHAVETGWGPQSTAERARSREAVMNYVSKLAGEADRATNEIAKLTQLPLGAPVRFRRLRAGKGFLPPRRKNDKVTGTLVRRRFERDGTITVLPLHNIRPEHRERVAACCYREEQITIDELSTMRLRKMLAKMGHPGELVMPRVSVWAVGSVSETGPPARGVDVAS
jgi:hypothetical protein